MMTSVYADGFESTALLLISVDGSSISASLANQLNQVPEDVEGVVAHMPSHGGTVTAGHEFDMQILRPSHPQPDSHPPVSAAVPRSSASATCQRPVSMPRPPMKRNGETQVAVMAPQIGRRAYSRSLYPGQG
ncbi:hypothetical protein EV421DRAFT_777060 [Armillaria borealis]|uniref:Uncharacterized protein n=1 Tax=Armillaria borealis TaxID=47425 RepID=A0AA39JD06_9AGAR|nr:hypothetical protein EV421DRAFT_777060 [Armillaria borealis]